MVTKNSISLQGFTDRKLVQFPKVTLAGGASATEVCALPVVRGGSLVVKGTVFASCGSVVGPFAGTADASTDFITAVAHGLVAGQPVFVATLTGVTATTIYYAGNFTSADVFQLYDTAAHAVTGNGSTGLIDITAGTACVVTTTALHAAYTVTAMAHNRNGHVTVVGSASVISVEDVAGWDFTVAADDSAKTLQLKGTPDASFATSFTGWLEVFSTAL